MLHVHQKCNNKILILKFLTIPWLNDEAIIGVFIHFNEIIVDYRGFPWSLIIWVQKRIIKGVK